MRVRPAPPTPLTRRRPRYRGVVFAALAALSLSIWAWSGTTEQSRTSEKPLDSAPAREMSAHSTAAEPVLATLPTNGVGEADTNGAVQIRDPSVFSCTVTKVHDGDGPLWCQEGPRVRLSGIAARELDGSCSSGHPCPSASAEEARATLEQFALGEVLNCRQVGTSYSRVVALCSLPNGDDLSCAMVRSGTALRWDRYDPDGLLLGCG